MNDSAIFFKRPILLTRWLGKNTPTVVQILKRLQTRMSKIN